MLVVMATRYGGGSEGRLILYGCRDVLVVMATRYGGGSDGRLIL